MSAVIDLQALRFPVAQIHLNNLLDKFIESETDIMTIISIEPMLRRCIEQRIIHRELPLSLQDNPLIEKISQQHIVEWGEDFDEEDYEDVSNRIHYTIKRLRTTGQHQQR